MLDNDEIRRAYDSADYYIDRSGKLYRTDNYIKKPQFVEKKKLYFANYKSLTKGKGVRYSLHNLIAEAYLPEQAYKIPGKVIKFKDGDRLNIHASNLYWADMIDRSKARVVLEDKDIREGDILDRDLVDKWIKDGVIKEIENSPGYYIHENGFVIEIGTPKVLTTFLNEDKYMRLSLPSKKHGKRTNFTIHLLVAQGFLEEQAYRVEGKTINHKDGDKYNNHYTNLEWITIGENIRHAHKEGLVGKNFAVYIIDTHMKDKLDIELGNNIIKCNSIREASRILKIDHHQLYSKITFSDRKPILILNRYILKPVNEADIIKGTAGTTKIYLYDCVNDKETVMYGFTNVGIYIGIRGRTIKRIFNKRDTSYRYGWIISRKPIGSNTMVSKEQAIKDRKEHESSSIYEGIKKAKKEDGNDRTKFY
jgi:hypothetical protein